MKYLISAEAQFDLEEIWLYTRHHWSIQQANHYVGLIIDEIEYLALNSYSGEDFGDLRSGYYRSRVKSHFIFYRVEQESSSVQIIRILHQRMDVESHLDT